MNRSPSWASFSAVHSLARNSLASIKRQSRFACLSFLKTQDARVQWSSSAYAAQPYLLRDLPRGGRLAVELFERRADVAQVAHRHDNLDVLLAAHDDRGHLEELEPAPVLVDADRTIDVLEVSLHDPAKDLAEDLVALVPGDRPEGGGVVPPVARVDEDVEYPAGWGSRASQDSARGCSSAASNHSAAVRRRRAGDASTSRNNGRGVRPCRGCSQLSVVSCQSTGWRKTVQEVEASLGLNTEHKA